MAVHNEIGNYGEDIAANYLIKKGYVIRDRNWKMRHRDLDIIALTEDMTTMVFVEVKTRKYDTTVYPGDNIDAEKIRNLGRLANTYIKKYNVYQEVRFDIIYVYHSGMNDYRIEHIEDAFNPCLL